MIHARSLAVLFACLSALAFHGQTAFSQGLSAKTWVGRHEEIEEYLRTAECESTQMLDSGSGMMRCALRPGGLFTRMAWRPVPPGNYRGFWESYKAEIAAYEMDKLLKMDMLPPAVEREVQGKKGSAIQWVENTVDLKAASLNESSRASWEKQLAQMTIFDNLIGNPVRNAGNMLRDPVGNLILLDHSRSFRYGTDLSRPLGRIDAGLWNSIQALTRTQLEARLGPWLDPNEITAILERRDKMKADIDRLIAERGAAAVYLR